ncbi:alanine/glycine:cation symporter family protein [Arenimonas sp.]|uniref:alanine/glycine:cation symporter family protein n=1 Tax=Arenimonas sp. TaxID=1872635 RepID=UPI002E31E55F|nr:alanine/glycine:cation symporter family protein [Arenimonas sp.]HEX4854652.1 alanine/glycine:cation symporter family protein [Arenimonas sp.]
MRRFLAFLLAGLCLPATVLAQAPAAPGLDERIDAMFKPVADAIAGVVLHAVPVGGQGAAIPLIVAWLILGGLVATVAFRFINVRGFVHGFRLIRGDYADPGSVGEVSHFRALTAAVSGTVGLGNIAGVAIAITIGGPGATFWMIVAGLLGMSAKFAECALGVMYRVQNADGTVSGGPMYYLSRGIAANYPALAGLGMALAGFYALCVMAGAAGSGAMFQANQAYAQLLQVTGGAEGPLAGRGWLFGIGIATLTGLVVLGGMTRIGAVTARLVPGMALLYVLGALFVIGSNVGQVPAAFQAILEGAFTAPGVQGGVIGALIMGFQRAAFSNEAGLGSAAIAHSAVKTREPMSEGFVALWEPFIDTVVICTMTALVIIITNQHTVGGADGIALTSNAFATVAPWFPYALTVVVFLFAFSTMITWAYYGAKACGFLFRESRWAQAAFTWVFLAMVVVGCSVPLSSLMGMADSLVLSMALPNLIGVYLLMPVLRRELASYQARLASGEIRPVVRS